MGLYGQCHAPAALPPSATEMAGSHCIGGWVGHGTARQSLDGRAVPWP